MNQLVYQVNSNSIMTEETFKTYLKGRKWNVRLTPIDNEEYATLYEGDDLDMVIGRVSTPNWGEYIITQVAENKESILGMFGVEDEPTIYIVKCFELM